MIIRALLFISFVLTGISAADEQLVFVSLSKEKQIAVYLLDTEPGTLSLKNSVPTNGSPASMCVNKEGNRLYVSMKQTGSIAAYKIEDRAELTLLGETVVGADPSYLSLHPSEPYLFSSYYAAGQVAAHLLNTSGGFATTPPQIVSTDERAHSVAVDPAGKFVFVPHTRPNSIFQFNFNNKLTPNNTPKLLRKDKAGPRHLWFHPTNGFAYGSDEQGCSITAYRLNQESGELKVTQTLSSLPDPNFEGRKSTSDIEVHPSGNFVYIANRGCNFIAGYAIDDTGNLTLVSHTPTEPVTRSFNISPDGKHLIAAGQISGKLGVFKIGKDGKLDRTSTIEAGEKPWWVQFTPSS